MISDSTLEKVRDVPIEKVIEPYVKLIHSGGHSLKGLCPFHTEKAPSLSVSLSKNLYHCFGCNRCGDGISFIMDKENLSFMEAHGFHEREVLLVHDEGDTVTATVTPEAVVKVLAQADR